MSGAVAQGMLELFRGRCVAGLGESALLDRFLHRGDGAAFEAIVQRHGPLVLAVCRRLLRDPHDVDDAFQATFLVLVRKAPTLRRRDALGAWLYGVAFKVASRARAQAATRPDGLPEGCDVPGAGPPAESLAERDESVEALLAEVAGLPEVYRAPVVLCYLEGLTHDEAAERLRWPVGTVRGRLARARNRLRDRLSRRGVGPVALGSGVPVLSLPSLPLPLAESAARAASAAAKAGSLAALTTSSASLARPAALAQGVIHAMSWNPWKAAILLVAAAGTAVGSGVALSAGEGRKLVPARPDAGVVQKDANPFEAITNKRAPRPYLPNLPADAFPAPKEVDAAASIREAQKAYDEELKELRKSRTSLRADVEILETQIEVIKKQLSEMETQRLRYREPGAPEGRENDPEIGRIRKEREQLEWHRDRLTLLLKDTIHTAEEARASSDEAERRYQALRERPRPAERVEVRIGDHVLVEVLEALPGRPISGERFVRADGKMSLGFYGELYVAGMTTDEIKERVVHLLRKFLDDEVLGLIVVDVKTGKPLTVSPKETTRVFVDITEDWRLRPATTTRRDARDESR
ncbi:MAG: sigma-70 family RNA polymerase sigma factor [Isosphaeraceae bacterium]